MKTKDIFKDINLLTIGNAVVVSCSIQRFNKELGIEEDNIEEEETGKEKGTEGWMDPSFITWISTFTFKDSFIINKEEEEEEGDYNEGGFHYTSFPLRRRYNT
ncbi:hypothetical protein H8356DRAFT_1355672 [Neocallimastix lanati (nom. inval.)]|nr:hypothetical protein H8356DRAFT_1355672 [Neocallimastix sp. JGI-2020a]